MTSDIPFKSIQFNGKSVKRCALESDGKYVGCFDSGRDFVLDVNEGTLSMEDKKYNVSIEFVPRSDVKENDPLPFLPTDYYVCVYSPNRKIKCIYAAFLYQKDAETIKEYMNKTYESSGWLFYVTNQLFDEHGHLGVVFRSTEEFFSTEENMSPPVQDFNVHYIWVGLFKGGCYMHSAYKERKDAEKVRDIMVDKYLHQCEIALTIGEKPAKDVYKVVKIYDSVQDPKGNILDIIPQFLRDYKYLFDNPSWYDDLYMM